MADTDLFTAIQNVAIALNTQSQLQLYVAGTQVSALLTTGTKQIDIGAGRIVRIIIANVSGANKVLTLYDSANTVLLPSEAILSITIEVGKEYNIGVPYSLGLVAVVDANSAVRVVYSTDPPFNIGGQQ
jgi:hypothetical protein